MGRTYKVVLLISICLNLILVITVCVLVFGDNRTGTLQKKVHNAVVTMETTSIDGENVGLAKGQWVTLEATVNMRKEMTSDSEKVCKVSKGETVTIIENYDSGWTKVQYGEKEGYIKTELLL